MTATATTEPPASRAAGRFATRHPLASARALTGAALVAAAVVGAFVAAGGGEAPAPPPRVVAAVPVAPGSVLTLDDLDTTAADLGTADGGAFSAPEELVGAVAVAPLAAGELVQASAVVLPPSAGPPTAPQITVRLPIDRALGGRLQSGELVDVIATIGTGEAATTEVVARRVAIVRAEVADGGLDAATVAVTLAPGDEDEVLALVHASEVGAVVLSRPGGRP